MARKTVDDLFFEAIHEWSSGAVEKSLRIMKRLHKRNLESVFCFIYTHASLPAKANYTDLTSYWKLWLRFAESLVKEYPKNQEAKGWVSFFRAESNLNEGKHAKAIQVLEKSCKSENLRRNFTLLTNLYQKTSQYEKIIGLLSPVGARLDPYQEEMLADAYLKRHMFNESVQYYLKGLGSSPEDMDDMPNFLKTVEPYLPVPGKENLIAKLVQALTAAGKGSKALQLCEGILGFSVCSVKITYTYVSYCNKLEQRPRAIAFLKRLLARKKGSARVFPEFIKYCIGLSYLVSFEFSKVIRWMTPILRMDNPPINLTLAKEACCYCLPDGTRRQETKKLSVSESLMTNHPDEDFTLVPQALLRIAVGGIQYKRAQVLLATGTTQRERNSGFVRAMVHLSLLVKNLEMLDLSLNRVDPDDLASSSFGYLAIYQIACLQGLRSSIIQMIVDIGFRNYPKHYHFLDASAFCDYDEGRYAAASKKFLAVSKNNESAFPGPFSWSKGTLMPNFTQRAFYYHGICEMEQGNYGKALDVFWQALEDVRDDMKTEIRERITQAIESRKVAKSQKSFREQMRKLTKSISKELAKHTFDLNAVFANLLGQSAMGGYGGTKRASDQDALCLKVEIYLARLLMKGKHKGKLRAKDVAKALSIPDDSMKDIVKRLVANIQETDKRLIDLVFRWDNYVNYRRIEAAKEMLSATTMPVSQIWDDLGFTNHQAFCKTFRQFTFGDNPTSYRKKLRLKK